MIRNLNKLANYERVSYRHVGGRAVDGTRLLAAGHTGGSSRRAGGEAAAAAVEADGGCLEVVPGSSERRKEKWQSSVTPNQGKNDRS